MKKITAVLSFFLMTTLASQGQTFTHADTLRGSNGPGRAWWDATNYDLHVNFDLVAKSISGYNIISYKSLNHDHPGYFQIDLQSPMMIDSVLWQNGPQGQWLKLPVTRDGNAWFIHLNDGGKAAGARNRKSKSAGNYSLADGGVLTVFYHGSPRVAKNAPWDGGIIWKKDTAGNDWVTVACQGLGASVWYPCKDYQGDEPDSASMSITAPSDLQAISNGRMRSTVKNTDGTTTTTWAVVSPINSYNLIPYIGKYVHFGEIYKGEAGDVTMDYWVLDSNLAKAKEQFKDAPRMMKALEYWFGPYPFRKDGYKLVEASHLGMEHQSAVAYGNGFKNGYLGRDLSGTGQGLKFDFIIVHESGHEWFGNNITSVDVADMWVHESFTNYSETLFLEYYYGKQAADEYVQGIRKNIANKKPVEGIYGVQQEGSGDMYYKGANMIHTIRQVINDDNSFRNILRGMNKDFYHKTVTGKQVEKYISNKSGIDFSKVFDQYLRTIDVPVLEWKQQGENISYRWSNCVTGFNMPVKIYKDNGEFIFVKPATEYQKAPAGISKIVPDANFYIQTKKAE